MCASSASVTRAKGLNLNKCELTSSYGPIRSLTSFFTSCYGKPKTSLAPLELQKVRRGTEGRMGRVSDAGRTQQVLLTELQLLFNTLLFSVPTCCCTETIPRADTSYSE